ncbi:MAG TPA: GNAT family N-acetyltransferase [Chitinophagaceae bacterium]|jgi:ribosomal protein S18 acetylase RimI-like enzyme|nr:GNAT family N-acetyltransferase [Chitinophagaceae bacterium]
MTEHFTICPAEPSDLTSLVALHVASWNATYPDYHPKPAVELRRAQWERLFRERPDRWFCYVAVTGTGTIAGFATGHDFPDPALPYRGQLDKIHLYKEYQRMGLGRQLVGRVARHFQAQGTGSMILFADPGNPNIAFYDRLGGTRLPDTNGQFQGAFGWMDLTPLVQAGAHGGSPGLPEPD